METLPGKNYAVANWSDAVADDNADTLPTVWSEPFVTDSQKMGIGIHVIIYNAQDANENTARCYFGVTVLGKKNRHSHTATENYPFNFNFFLQTKNHRLLRTVSILPSFYSRVTRQVPISHGTNQSSMITLDFR